MFQCKEGSMIYRPTPVALAVALAMLGTAMPVAAAEGTAAADQITVTGIRASKQKSLLRKRNAETVTEVVSAEDIGKMPDKNVADALQKLPGITTLTGSGGQGGYDENDRVSIRGTSASLALTTVNSHAVATADWSSGDQIANGGAARSVSYLLFPSEIVSQVVVHKSPQADQIEGGVSGSVNLITRRPLEFRQPFTAEFGLQAVYSDLAEKFDPQLNALFNWKNEANNFGVMVQLFSQERHVRRDSQRIGWSRIGADTTVGQANGGQLANAIYVNDVANLLFQQERKRTGGVFGAELKVNDALTLNVDGFYSKLDAKYANNYLVVRPGNSIADRKDASGNVVSPGIVPTNISLQNGVLTAAQFNNSGEKMGAQLESFVTPKATAQTQYINTGFKWNPGERFSLEGQIGTTKAVGDTREYNNYVFLPNTATAYRANGFDSPVTLSLPNGVNAANLSGNPGNAGSDQSFSLTHSLDKETYGQLDGVVHFNESVLSSLNFGLRTTDHKREGSRPSKAGNPMNAAGTGQVALTTIPGWNGETFPGDFGGNLGGTGNTGGTAPLISISSIEDWSNANLSFDRQFNLPVSGVFTVKEKTNAAYGMAKFAGERWRGDFGVRFVRTETQVTRNQGLPCGAAGSTYNGTTVTYGSPAQAQACRDGGFVPAGATLVTGSRFGNFIVTNTDHDYTEVLPSVNFAFDATDKLVLRAAAAKVMSRPDYTALGQSVGNFGWNASNNPPSTATGGNAELDPVVAWNYNLGAEWYFQPRAVLSAQLFYLDFESLIGSGTTMQDQLNTAIPASQGGPRIVPTLVNSPVSIMGRSQGVELGYEQPIFGGFGIQANYTYVDAEEETGQPIQGASRDSYTLGGYFENEKFSTRLTYSYRSKSRTGLFGTAQNYLAANGTVAASANYTVNDQLTLTFEGLNLNNPKLRYYNAPTATIPFEATTQIHSSGRQYYFGLRYKY